VSKSILLIGTGPMAAEYLKILTANASGEVTVAGRDDGRLAGVKAAFPGVDTFRLPAAGAPLGRTWDAAILATGIPDLAGDLERCLAAGIPQVLVEKPVTTDLTRLKRLADLAAGKGARVRVATNRRHYGSIRKLKAILAGESPLGASFDFTEWLSRVPKAWESHEGGQRLALSNSIHVFDTVEHLLGAFKKEAGYHGETGAVAWHPDPVVFFGYGKAGTTPVVYGTSWISPGRWAIEVMTREGRYRLAPMEKLAVLRHGTLEWKEIPLDNQVDLDFKPGLAGVVGEFLVPPGGGEALLPDLNAYLQMATRMADLCGYKAAP